MAILRHAQIAITMEVYTEVPDEVTRAALKRLGDQLDPHSHQHDPAADQRGRDAGLQPAPGPTAAPKRHTYCTGCSKNKQNSWI